MIADMYLSESYTHAYPRLLNSQYIVRRKLTESERMIWTFSTNGQSGANVHDALVGKLENLDDKDDDLYPATFEKVRYYIAVRVVFCAASTGR